MSVGNEKIAVGDFFVSINSTSEEVIGKNIQAIPALPPMFPLIRLPKKSLGRESFSICGNLRVSINSTSEEVIGMHIACNGMGNQQVSINSTSEEVIGSLHPSLIP